MFSSRENIVSGLIFRSLIHTEFIFVYGGKEYSNSFTCSCPVFPALFIEGTASSPLYSPASLSLIY